MSRHDFPLQVSPRLPRKIARLTELADNLWFSWHRQTRQLFGMLDRDLWLRVGRNPKVFLRCVDQNVLNLAVDNETFLASYRRVLAEFDSYRDQALAAYAPAGLKDDDLIAYFCAEYGFHDSVPLYSGGLGILAGDHCKTASDLRLPFVAVGLLYRQGYFTQRIDEHGRQLAEYRVTPAEDLPVTPLRDAAGNDVLVSIAFPGRSVAIRVWRAEVGRVPVLLLDTDVASNAEADRGITRVLYGGDQALRIQQELVLGVGGVRALRAAGLQPTVWHLNEGHPAFQVLEHGRVAQHEMSCLGTDHRTIGAWLLRNWNMPATLVRAVQHSHDASAAGVDPEHREFVRCVALSGELADAWLNDPSETGIRRVAGLANKHLNLVPNRLHELFSEIRDQIPVAEGLFDVEIFPADQAQELVESAREIMVVRNLYEIDRNKDLENQQSKLRQENSALKVESERDALTGVYNRRAFEDAVEREFSAASRSSWPLSVIFVDIDHFNGINDTHGHQGGDAMLKAVAGLLSGTLRDSDVVARYGGDEFVLLLPGVDANQVEAVADRLVRRAREARVDNGSGASFSVTLSLGIATRDARSTFGSSQDLLAAADAALYHSKRNGRNQHTSYDRIKAA